MDKTQTKDYLKHLESIGMKNSAEYKRASKAEQSPDHPKPKKKDK